MHNVCSSLHTITGLDSESVTVRELFGAGADFLYFQRPWLSWAIHNAFLLDAHYKQ